MTATQIILEALATRHNAADSKGKVASPSAAYKRRTGDSIQLSVRPRGYIPDTERHDSRPRYMIIREAMTLYAELPITPNQDVQAAMEAVQDLLIGDMVWLEANSRLLVGVIDPQLERCEVVLVEESDGRNKRVIVKGMLHFTASKTYGADDYEPFPESNYGVTVVPTQIISYFGLDDPNPETESLP